jgi:uncharacterized protein (TIGR03790 family)
VRSLTTFFPGIALLTGALFQQAASGQATHPEVLVVYNANEPDSLTVANHYMAMRNIPSPANLCSISPPVNDFLNNFNDYTTYVKTPIQNCLNTVGQKQILYIVMSYLTPFVVYGAGPMGAGSVDSYLGDIWDKYVSQPFAVVPNATQPYYADSQSQGNVNVPFQSFAAYRANPRNPLIYSVWRLDASTLAIANALVDQAMTAEGAGGPVGQGCIDHYFTNYATLPDSGYQTGDWDLHQSAVFLQEAMPSVSVTENDTGVEFYSSPTAATCPNSAFYSGWYSYDHYNSGFNWPTGAVGWHLDSASALNPRSGASWVPNALNAGITVTTGSVTEPYLQGLVRPGGTFHNLLEGASVGDAFLRNTRWLKWEIMYVGDPLYRPFGAGRPPFSPLMPVNSFQISPQEIVGGTNSTGTITLNAAAPGGGTMFSMSAPSGVTVPPTVTVAGGATKANFPITTAVSTGQASVITAISGALTLNNTITIDPLLGGFLTSAGTTMAGLPVTVTVALNGRAPIGGVVINLASDNPAVTVPATVKVPQGASVATFTAGSTPVSTPVTAHVTGMYAGTTVTANIAVVPAISSMASYPNPINPGGFTVVSVTLGTNVPAGYTATIQLTSSDPGTMPAPMTITIPAGTNYGNFGTAASAGAAAETVTFTGTYGGATGMTTVTIN